jgi:hypothetical protein
LVALLLLAAVSIWFGRRSGHEPRDAGGRMPAQSFAAAAASAPEAAQSVHLVVLNGAGVDGLAARVGLLLAAAGCVVERVGDAPHPHFENSLLINRRLPNERAEALAARLGGVRILREWDPRASEDALLVLGADYDAVWKRLQLQSYPAAP